MNKISITEGNKLIAKFMGGRIVRTEKYEMPHGSHSEGEIEHWEFDHGYHMTRNEYANIGVFRFERDWNDLMAVVEKIENEDLDVFVEICGRRCEMSYMINHNWPHDKGELCDYNASNSASKIEAVWLAVVHYITEFNKRGHESTIS